jgi:hypothetical protein
MTFKIIGQPFPAGGVKQAKDTVTEDASGRKTITTTYRTLYSTWLINAPSRGSTHPTYPDASLVGKSAQQIEPGYLCEVTLTYNEPDPPDGSTTGGKLPQDDYVESVNDVELPIEAHPDFATFATEANGAIFAAPIPPMAQGDFKGWTKSSPFAGYMTFKAGSVTRSVTTYSWNKPASVSSAVGKKDGTNWLVVSGSVARHGAYWGRTINSIYSSVAWNTTIYPD